MKTESCGVLRICQKKIPRRPLFVLICAVSITWYLLFKQTLTYIKIYDLKNSHTTVDRMVNASVQLNTSSLHKVNPRSQYGHLRHYIPPETDLNDKYIIYRCSSAGLCGGLGDREKGIVTSYVISQMLRRKFGIIMKKGCEFSNYIIPNDVNWFVNEDKLKGRSVEVKRLIDNMKMGYTINNTRLENLFGKNVTYYEGNIDYVNFLMNKPSFKSVKWARNQTHEDIYRTAFAHLFKLATNTRERYERFRAKTENRSLICAHLRMGKSKTNPRDVYFPERRPNQELVIQFLKRKVTSTSKIFIATDSDEVRERMATAFPDNVIELGGKIVHIDRFGQQYDCSGLEKAILDQFILSTCDTLILSVSGFSKVSAVLRGTDDKLYLASPNNITKTKRVNPEYPYI